MTHENRDPRILRLMTLLVLAAVAIGISIFTVTAINSPMPLTAEEQAIVGSWTGHYPDDDRAVRQFTFHPNRRGLFEDGSSTYRGNWSMHGKSFNLEIEAVSNAWSIQNRVLALLSQRALKSDKMMFDAESLSDDEFRLTKNGELVMRLHRKRQN